MSAGLGLAGFDLVTAMEVLEHVADKAAFVAALAAALAPGGLLVLSTPNRTAKSRLLLVEGAERLGAIPRGTHHWDDFVTPDELRALLAGAGLAMGSLRGIAWSPMQGLHLSDDISLDFLVTAQRRMSASGAACRRTVAGLLVLGLVLAAYPLIRAFYDFEIDYNEGWNGYLQLRAGAGEPLYAGYSPLYFNNYPPLSFYLAGWLGALTGDPVLAGRLVSLAALAAICAACGAVVRGAGGERSDGLLAGATALLLFTVFATDYLGMNDPQLLGQAFATGALALHLTGAPSPRRAALTALLLVLSVLTKHNLVVVPLLLAVDIARSGEQRQRAAFFGTGLALAALAAALLWSSAGPAFFAQLLAPRTWEVDRAFLFTTEILGRYQAPLALAAIGLVAARRRRPAGLILAYLVLSLAAGSWFSGGAGTDINVFFDIAIAASIGAGLAADELRRRGGSDRQLAALALAFNAGALFQAPLALGRFGVDLAGEMAERERLFGADTAWLRAQRGPVVCQSQLLCLRAGKPMFYDSLQRQPGDAHRAAAGRHAHRHARARRDRGGAGFGPAPARSRRSAGSPGHARALRQFRRRCLRRARSPLPAGPDRDIRGVLCPGAAHSIIQNSAQASATAARTATTTSRSRCPGWKSDGSGGNPPRE